MDNQFEEFYKEFDKAGLKALKIEGQKVGNIKLVQGILIGLSIICFFLITNLALKSPSIIIISLIVWGATGLFIWLSSYNIKDFNLKFKKQVVEKIIKQIDSNLNYEPSLEFPQDKYDDSGIGESYTNYYSDDLITGKLQGIPVNLAEVHTERVVHSGKTTSRVTLFHGLFMEVQFNKKFSGETKIVPDKSLGICNFIESTCEKMFGRTNKEVVLESPEFNSMFNVYSTDQVEARYILSTSFMERLMEFNTKLEVDTSFSFYKSNMYIKIDYGHELFEPSLGNENCVSKKEIYNLYCFVTFIKSIIEELKINQNLFGGI